jgi:nucleoid-associated protein YgaU
MNKLRLLIVSSVSALSLFAACGEPLPFEDLVAAKSAIGLAFSVKADKYAAEEINAATAKLYEAHDFIKNDDAKKASASAQEAKKLADGAFSKACPLVAKDTIDIAGASLADAVEAGADEIASSEYGDAQAAFESASQEYENKNYRAAYFQALEADKKAKEARNVALGKKDILKDAIDEVRITLSRAREYNAAEYAPENLELAEEYLTTAEDAYSDLKLKAGFAAVETAKVNADEAYLKALKETAGVEIAKSKALLADAEASGGSKIAVDELSAAQESYKNAEAMYAEGRYREAIEYAKEAALLSNIVVAQQFDGSQNVSSADDSQDVSSIDDSQNVSSADDKDYFLYTVTYKSKLKDCLWRIAGKYYGDPHKWKHIYNANKDKIKNPDFIYPGWVIKVPKLH